MLNAFNEDTVNDIYLSRMDFTVRTLRTNGAASRPEGVQSVHRDSDRMPAGQTAAQCTALGAHWQLGPNFGKAINKDALPVAAHLPLRGRHPLLSLIPPQQRKAPAARPGLFLFGG